MKEMPRGVGNRPQFAERVLEHVEHQVAFGGAEPSLTASIERAVGGGHGRIDPRRVGGGSNSRGGPATPL